MKMMLTASVLAMTATVCAGDIDFDLQDKLEGMKATDSVSVLVHLQQVDLETLAADLDIERASRQTRHEEVVRALQSQADWTQPAVLLELDAIAAAGEIDSYESFWISNCIRVDTIVGKVDDLAAIPGVETIYFNYPIELVGPTGIEAASDTTFNPLGAVEPGLLAINADDCWSAGYDGTGVLVANLDTGVQGDHEALESRWAGLRPEYAGNPEWAWLDYNAGSTTPWDHHWHGTHTMGTICGGSPGDSIGVAPGAHWIAGGGLDAGSIGDTVAGNLLVLEWMLDPDGDPSTVWDVPAVVGNSWGLLTGHGYPNCDDTFWAHLDALHAGGTVVIFAAGNEGSGSNTLRRPGDRAINDFTTHAVAAVDAETAGWPVAGFSSRGPTYCTSDGSAAIKPDISAPGVGIRSAWSDGGYGDSNGTSMATPHVAGVVALMIQACPDLTPTEVHTILFDTASDLGPAGKDNDYGYGMIDAWAAVQEALAQCGGGGGVDCACDAEFNVGDRVQALVDDPQGGTGIVAGQCGTVICGRFTSDTFRILIEWDDWYAGHDNTSFCECPDGESSGTASCWWVDCPDIAAGCEPAATGACCVDTSCSISTEADCAGTYLGDNTDCSGDPCAPTEGCVGDTNGDGYVNVIDLLAVIAAWGSNNADADLNDDGSVDVIDLLLVIANWGPCPGVCEDGWSCGFEIEDYICGENCYCLDLPDGSYACLDIQGGSCDEFDTCLDGTCPEGYVCVTSTCCEDPICLPYCYPPTGGCCVGTSCSITTEADCAGTYLGDDTDCSGDPCALNCADGFNCGDDADLFTCGGFSCYCMELADGTFACMFADGSCKQYTPCPDGTCPEGYGCVINTCCSGPVCVPYCD